MCAPTPAKGINSPCLGLMLLGLAIPCAAAPPVRVDSARSFVTDARPFQVIPMDLDDDGDVDTAVLSSPALGQPHLQLFENPGDGTLKPHAVVALSGDTALACADLNGDGRLDLVQAYSSDGVTCALTVLTRTGAFSFASRQQNLSFPGNNVCVGDLDHRSGLDLVVGDDLVSPLVHVLLSGSGGSYAVAGTYETESSTRDVDGDGTPDRQTPINVRDFVCRDVNQDGYDDLIVTNSIGRTLSSAGQIVYVTDVVMLLNNGAGGFGPYTLLTNWGGDRLCVGDVDGNTTPDIVTTGVVAQGSTGIHMLIVLRNTGGGVFLVPEHYELGNGIDPVSMGGLADVDLDGDLDAAVRLSGPAAVTTDDHPTDFWTLLRNDGRGVFGPPVIHPAGADITDLAIADLDAFDGPEVLTLAMGDARLAVAYNQGGRYPSPRLISIDDPRHPTFGNQASDIVTGDFSKDGLADLAVLATVSGYIGPQVKDVLALLPGGPTCPLEPAWLDLRESPARLHADAIAGDAAADIAVVFQGDVLTSTPMGVGLFSGMSQTPPAAMKFATLPGMPADVTALDVNSDTVQDLAVVRSRSSEGFAAGVAILAVSASGGLTYLGDLLLGSDDVLDADSRMPEAIAAGDVDGDGRKDIVAATWNIYQEHQRKINVIGNLGNLNFILIGEFSVTGDSVQDIVATDLTGDGLADIALVTQPNVFYGDESGALWVVPYLDHYTFGQPVRYDVGKGPVRLAAGLINSDTAVDLVVACDLSNEITLLLNDGSGGFAVQERYLSGGGADAVALADLDHDGDLDIAVSNDNDVVGAHRATVGIVTNRAVSPVPVGADFDGDLDVDADDYALFAQCVSGPAIAYPGGLLCERTDLDGDDDVDQVDFGVFQRCLTGSGVPADATCAESR